MLCACLALAAVDRATPWLGGLRALLEATVVPFLVLADAPRQAQLLIGRTLTARSALEDRIGAQDAEILHLRTELQRLATLEAENARLRRLLSTRDRTALDVEAVEIIGVVPDPGTRQVVVDKGAEQGVSVGQAVVDARGLFGQVLSVTPFSARVLLVTDVSHAVPVQVARTGQRLVVGGLGDADLLEVRHVSETVDLAVGDLLTTSGLGRLFPPDLPVAEVVEVGAVAVDGFLRVRARPMADLSKSTHVLLVRPAPER